MDKWDGPGVSWLWGLPRDHPFYGPHRPHDEAMMRGESTIKDDIACYKRFVKAGLENTNPKYSGPFVARVEAPIALLAMFAWRLGSRVMGRKI